MNKNNNNKTQVKPHFSKYLRELYTTFCIPPCILELRPKRPQTKTATAKTATSQTKTATRKIQNGHKPKWPQPKRPHVMVIRSANM